MAVTISGPSFFSALGDLDLLPFDLKVAMSVAKEMGNLSSEFKRCIVFRFRVNGEHGRTDGLTDMT